MKYRDLTVEYIMTLDEDALYETKYSVRSIATGVKKALKKLETRPITSDAQAKELAHQRSQVAKSNALMEAIMTREDELYGPGVLSTYDHSQSF